MSLLKWSTSERQSEDRCLLIIPTEIYLLIFEYIAPYAGRLTPEDLKIFTSLSCVCRFFANVCLPRVFEFVEFSGSIFHDDTPGGLRDDATYKLSRGSRLCRQIVEKDPLAIAITGMVKVCYFTNWEYVGPGTWATRLSARKYLTAGLLHLKNVRELEFTKCAMHAEYWKAIASLESLEELSFDSCLFFQGAGDVEPEKVRVARLKVEKGRLLRFLDQAIDYRCLRALSAPPAFVCLIDWPPDAILTELTLTSSGTPPASQIMEVGVLKNIIEKAPRTLETFFLSVRAEEGLTRAVVRDLLGQPAWKTFSRLHSLTLCLRESAIDNQAAILLSTLRNINLMRLRSFTLKDSSSSPPKIPLAEIQGILHDNLSPESSLVFIDFYGMTLALVEGRWSEVSPTGLGA